MHSTDNFSHSELIKESHLSLALLKEIMHEEDIAVENHFICYYGIPLEDKDKKLLVYNIDTIQLRRKNKEKYIHFNIFNNNDHLTFILNKIYEFDNDIDCLEVKRLNLTTEWYSVKLKNTDNKVMKEIQVYDTSKLNLQRSIVRLLLNYYNII